MVAVAVGSGVGVAEGVNAATCVISAITVEAISVIFNTGSSVGAAGLHAESVKERMSRLTIMPFVSKFFMAFSFILVLNLYCQGKQASCQGKCEGKCEGHPCLCCFPVDDRFGFYLPVFMNEGIR